MSAEIHQLPPGPDARDDADDLPLAPSGSVYLDAYLAPFRQWLDRDTVTEIIVNRPGEIWIEDAEQPGMRRIKAPQIDDKLVQRLAEQVARVSHQGINREHPLLGATLPDGARIQFCGPPATRKHWAMAIRRHRRLDLPLDAYDAGPLRTAPEHEMPDPAEQPIAFLRAINTGHPGSFSTIHANSLRGALEQLALMVMQTGIGLTRGDTIAYAASVIDVIVQLDRKDGKRGISAIARSSELI